MNSCLCKYGYVFCIAFELDNWTNGVSKHWRGVYADVYVGMALYFVFVFVFEFQNNG